MRYLIFFTLLLTSCYDIDQLSQQDFHAPNLERQFIKAPKFERVKPERDCNDRKWCLTPNSNCVCKDENYCDYFGADPLCKEKAK